MTKQQTKQAKETLADATAFAKDLRELVLKHKLDTETVQVILGPPGLLPNSKELTAVYILDSITNPPILIADWSKDSHGMMSPTGNYVITDLRRMGS